MLDKNIMDKFEKNPAFKEEFEKRIKHFEFLRREDSVNYNRGNYSISSFDGNVRIVFTTGISQSKYNSEAREISYTRVDFKIDENGNLVIDEAYGTINSDVSFTYEHSKPTLYTSFDREVFDSNGIELSNAHYVDSYPYDRKQCLYVGESKDFSMVEGAYKADLANGMPPKIIGQNGRYSKIERSNENLGLLRSITRNYQNNNNMTVNKGYQEEYFFNVFMAGPVLHPEKISYIPNAPFMTYDATNGFKINDEYQGIDLNANNYQEVALYRFKKELEMEKENLERSGYHNIEESIERYDTMLEQVDKSLESKKSK